MQNLRNLRKERKIGIIFLILLIIVPFIVQVTSNNLVDEPIIHHLKINAVSPQEIDISNQLVDEFLEEFSQMKQKIEIRTLLGLEAEKSPQESKEYLKEQAKEIVIEHAQLSQDGLINVLADLTSLLSFTLLVYWGRRQFMMVRNFLSSFFLSLSDVTKVFIFILITDMFVSIIENLRSISPL